jgi:type I restriction enzyme S subunit
MNELKKTTLRNEVDFLVGFPFKSEGYSSEGVRLLRGDNIAQGTLSWNDAKKWPTSQQEDFELYELQEGDVVLAMDRPWIDAGLKYASISRYDLPCLLVQRTARLRGGKNLDTKFLRYVIGSPQFTKYIQHITTGSLVPHISGDQIKDFSVHLPHLSTQQKIAAVLSALDAKIELNNRINGELEAMAKTLYDYWFVQFDFPDQNGQPYKSSGGKMVYNDTLKRGIPAGWYDSNILAVADLLGGGTPTKKKPEYWSGKIPFFTPTDADSSIFKFSTEDYITNEGLKNSSTKLFDENTVFITARGSVGRLVLAGVKMAMNQSCYAIKAKAGVSYVFLFFLVKELIHHLQVKSSGSVFDSIVSNDIEHTIIAIPTSSLIERYAQIIEPAFSRIAKTTLENQQLTQLRDWLLPMLMNGQVTVK